MARLLRSSLLAIAAGVTPVLDGAVKAAADVGKASRDRLVPIDTGALKASGVVVRVGDAHYQIREGDGIPDARAAFTEYGTDRQRAQPHMTPAAEDARRALRAAVGNAVRVVVRRHAL